jgi:SH3-like domain-containing protein
VNLDIVAPHVIPDYAALELATGDRVRVIRRDHTWPAFVWCETADGRAGWIPESYLGGDEAQRPMQRGYSSRELPVRPGDVVTFVDECGGWYLVEDARGETGWIPAACSRAQPLKRSGDQP